MESESLWIFEEFFVGGEWILLKSDVSVTCKTSVRGECDTLEEGVSFQGKSKTPWYIIEGSMWPLYWTSTDQQFYKAYINDYHR